MRRLHLVELHELSACPRAWREGLTDFLHVGMTTTRMFDAVLPRLGAALRATGDARVVDLCSGGGGVWLGVLDPLRRAAGAPVDVVLTDLHPSEPARRRVARREGLVYEERPVDARAVPDELEGFRTMFNAFHQFRPEEARAVLADAVADGRGIAVLEATERSALGLFLAISLPGVVWLLTPFVRPWSWRRLFWTYVVPVLPFLIAHDAVVSCLRSYDLDELDALTAGLGGDGWRWERGRAWAGWFPNRVTWLIGAPTEGPRAT